MVEENLDAELFLYGLKIGKAWGNELTEYYRDKLIPDEPVILQLPIEKLGDYTKFSKPIRGLMLLGSENFGVVGNSLISGSAVITCGLSGIGLTTTNSPTAKGFYALSCAFSGTAATTGSMSVLARKCEISEVAMLTEVVGAAFLFLGNKAHAAALRIEGRPVPARFRRAAPSFGLYNPRNNAAFIMPFRSSRIIEGIPFEKIGKTVGFSISIYCYGRIIITGYRYGQQLIGNYRKKKLLERKKKNLLKASKLLISSIYTNKAVWKRKKLYYFVIS